MWHLQHLLRVCVTWRLRRYLINKQAVSFKRGHKCKPKAAFTWAKFLCHISHALQSLLIYFCGIITVNLYSKTDTDEKLTNINYRFVINDCRACNLWQRKCARVHEPLCRRSKPSIRGLFKHYADWCYRVKTVRYPVMKFIWQQRAIFCLSTLKISCS